jgi:hypothetical protein
VAPIRHPSEPQNLAGSQEILGPATFFVGFSTFFGLGVVSGGIGGARAETARAIRFGISQDFQHKVLLSNKILEPSKAPGPGEDCEKDRKTHVNFL